MSHDPFHDLFNSEIPRPASAASTRSTLDTLAPQFHRAKARRRARVSAVAAFAVLGTTGGAAALGVGPVAYNNGPLNRHSPVASSSSDVENAAESTTTTTTTEPVADDTTTTVTVTTTTPTTIPDVEVEVADSAADGSNNSNGDAADVGSEPEASQSEGDSHSGDTSSSDSSSSDSSSSDSSSSDSSSSDSSSAPSTEPSHGPSKSSDTDSDASVPVAGPLTKSIDEGSATVDIGPNGLVIVGITPATGMGFEVESKPDTIDIQFHDLVSGDDMSALEFDLVDGGISVKVDHPH